MTTWIVLLACSPAPTATPVLYDLEPTGTSTTCTSAHPTPSLASVDVRFSPTLVDIGLPIRERCPLDGDRFECEPLVGEQSVDYGDFGMDALVAVNFGASGKVLEPDAFELVLSTSVSCVGEDCGAITGSAPEFCETAWSYLARPRWP